MNGSWIFASFHHFAESGVMELVEIILMVEIFGSFSEILRLISDEKASNKLQQITKQRTAGYELLNTALIWSPTDSLRVEARIDNLLDETYQDHVAGINRANGSDIPVGERVYGAERTLSAGVIWSF